MYQALYRKYRSQTFGEMVGQKVISTTLRQAVESGKITPRRSAKSSSGHVVPVKPVRRKSLPRL